MITFAGNDRRVMRALWVREALVAARQPALVLTSVGVAALLALFPIVWGVQGVPTETAMSLYDQQFRLQWALMVLVLPWTAARSVASERGNGLVYLCAMTSCEPSRILLARLLAGVGALALTVVAATPVAIASQQIAAVPLLRVAFDQSALVLFAVPAGAAAVWSMQIVPGRLSGWLVASTATLALAAAGRMLFDSMAQAVVAMTVVAIAVSIVLLNRADVWWRYLDERLA